MDYIKLLNLQAEPFSNSPDPSFFFLSRTYQDCLQNLEISIRLRRGLNLVLGDIGTGKTTLSRALIQQFQSEADQFLFHLILDPSFKTEQEFLYTLIMGFGINPPAKKNLFAYKEAIRQFLLTEGLQKGRVVVLIVDEGQKLNDVCLELLRDLLNFETNQFKLLQLIIMAQKEFHEKIKDKRNLTDRINTFYTIRPLDKNETRDMIQFRLGKAGWVQNHSLFSSKAMDRIYHYSRGYPRRIITICHHSLLMMLVKKADIVEPEMVEHAVSQLYEFSVDGNGTEDGVISDADLPYRSGHRLNWTSLRDLFPFDRLLNPVLSTILIFILFLTLLWATRNMKWSNFNDKNAIVEQPAVTAEDSIESFPVHAYENKDMPESGRYDYDISESPFFNDEKEGHGTSESRILTSMVVAEGDTIFNLAGRVYDIRINRAVLNQIRLVNPHIIDLDHIEVGDRIFFPRLAFQDLVETSPGTFVQP
ncbi:MAG: ExeA family protein [bacterium]